MKLIISGGRDYRLRVLDYKKLQNKFFHLIEEVVVGDATGVDHDIRAWAVFYEFHIRVFKADWKKHGKSAGPRRNADMAKYGDAVVLFPGG